LVHWISALESLLKSSHLLPSIAISVRRGRLIGTWHFPQDNFGAILLMSLEIITDSDSLINTDNYSIVKVSDNYLAMNGREAESKEELWSAVVKSCNAAALGEGVLLIAGWLNSKKYIDIYT
jgi:hypothetical protein